MSAFRRRGDWVAKFQLRGKQHWVPGGPWQTKRQAEEAERRCRDRLEARRTDETCASFADRWLEEWPRPSAGTRRTYAAARRFAAEFASTPLGDVERLSARAWALSVPRGVSRVVGIMYEDARNVGLVEHNPFANLRLPATERSEKIVAPTMEEYRALLEACTVLAGYGGEFRALIQFAAWTGMRSGEIQALRWEDVGAETIRVRRSRRRDGSVGSPKNGQGRTISLLPPAQTLDDVPRRPDPYVFHAVHGGPLLNGSLYYAWREVRSASGIALGRREEGAANIRFHDLRHFCATQLLELGVDHFAVSVQLGHEDGGALVMARYGHPSKDAARGRLQAAFYLAANGIGSSTGNETAADGF